MHYRRRNLHLYTHFNQSTSNFIWSMHFILQLLNDYPRDLVTLKRAQVLCFYMGRPDLSLDLVQQVHFCPDSIRYILLSTTLGLTRLFISTGSTQKPRRRLYIWHACVFVIRAGPNGWCWGSSKKGIWDQQARLLGATCCGFSSS